MSRAIVFGIAIPLKSKIANYFEQTKICTHSIGVAQLLKRLIKVLISLYFLNILMDLVDTLHVVRY